MLQVKLSAQTIKQGWVEYIKQPVLPASLAYVLLNFNIGLSPGGLMTAFLTQKGIPWALSNTVNCMFW